MKRGHVPMRAYQSRHWLYASLSVLILLSATPAEARNILFDRGRIPSPEMPPMLETNIQAIYKARAAAEARAKEEIRLKIQAELEAERKMQEEERLALEELSREKERLQQEAEAALKLEEELQETKEQLRIERETVQKEKELLAKELKAVQEEELAIKEAPKPILKEKPLPEKPLSLQKTSQSPAVLEVIKEANDFMEDELPASLDAVPPAEPVEIVAEEIPPAIEPVEEAPKEEKHDLGGFFSSLFSSKSDKREEASPTPVQQAEQVQSEESQPAQAVFKTTGSVGISQKEKSAQKQEKPAIIAQPIPPKQEQLPAIISQEGEKLAKSVSSLQSDLKTEQFANVEEAPVQVLVHEPKDVKVVEVEPKQEEPVKQETAATPEEIPSLESMFKEIEKPIETIVDLPDLSPKQGEKVTIEPPMLIPVEPQIEPEEKKEEVAEEEIPSPIEVAIEEEMKDEGEAQQTIAEIEEMMDPMATPQSLLPNTFDEQQPAVKELPASMQIAEPEETPKTEEVSSPPPIQPEAPKQQEIAAVAPQPASMDIAMPTLDNVYTIGFLASEVEAGPQETAQVNSVVALLNKNPTARLRIISYATSADQNVSEARRISLKRALSVRKYMIDQGVDSTRINVQAMGDATKGKGLPDRIDIIFIGDRS